MHWGMFSTLGDTIITSGDIMSTSRGIFSTLGGASFSIMMHVGEQVGKNLSISIENPNVLNIPRCTEHTLHRVGTSNISHVSRKPLQCMHVTNPYTAHVAEVRF